MTLSESLNRTEDSIKFPDDWDTEDILIFALNLMVSNADEVRELLEDEDD
tara:strand:- start:630 stop:779 length:150 start_codon:yes stop_codon:yes gene_type:complete